MREAAQIMLNMPVSRSQSTMKAVMASLGVPEEDADYNMAVMSAMILAAGNGNVNAAQFLRDTAGDNPHVRVREKELEMRKSEQEKILEESNLADSIVSAFNERMEGRNE